MEINQTTNIKLITDYLVELDKKIEKRLSEIKTLKEKQQAFKTCLDILKNNITKKTKHKKNKKNRKNKKHRKTKNKTSIKKTLATKNDLNNGINIKTEDTIINPNESSNKKPTWLKTNYVCNGYHKYGPENMGVKICLNCSAELIVK